jgi:hypothetical protein
VKGVIFKVFEEFVVTNFGEDVYEDVYDATPLETTGPFVGPGTYPASDLLALVQTATEQLGISVEEAVRAFGAFAFPALAGSVRPLMDQFDDVASFLLGLESVVHTEVRKIDRDASPARFSVERVDDHELTMHYESPLGLFPLVHGLLDGAAAWFGEPFDHEMVASEGTNATFRLTFAPTPVGVGAPTGAVDG